METKTIKDLETYVEELKQELNDERKYVKALQEEINDLQSDKEELEYKLNDNEEYANDAEQNCIDAKRMLAEVIDKFNDFSNMDSLDEAEELVKSAKIELTQALSNIESMNHCY